MNEASYFLFQPGMKVKWSGEARSKDLPQLYGPPLHVVLVRDAPPSARDRHPQLVSIKLRDGSQKEFSGNLLALAL
ncbi:hypothetical protein HY250_02530 [Candidatus Azambacteria bacterium]|nr:hypothetical protein [Candidatus Azambacteria bacterium]